MARELSSQYSIEAFPVSCDLATPDATGQIRDAIGDRMINFMVYNAALSHIGPFLNKPVSEHIQIAEVNMLTPMKMLQKIPKSLDLRIHLLKQGIWPG
ncbi:MAG TPA: hypothetical protein VFC34_02815 [Puia sp.]|nr:hypothetical protein [Puia sp.]